MLRNSTLTALRSSAAEKAAGLSAAEGSGEARKASRRGGRRKGQQHATSASAASSATELPKSCAELAKLLPPPPKCMKKAHEIAAHGYVRQDPYYWLREKEKSEKEIKKHLKSEDKYSDTFLEKATGTLKNDLFTEMKKRWKETDSSLPSKDRDYWYYSRIVKGKDHPIMCRVPFEAHPNMLYEYCDELKKNPDADVAKFRDEQVIVDLNVIAKQERCPNVEMGDFDISPNQEMVAFTVDLSNGREEFAIIIGDLRDGKGMKLIRKIEIFTNGGEVVWGSNSVLYYTFLDDTQRPCGIVQHCLDQPLEDADRVIYEEEDETFALSSLSKTDDELYLTFYTEGRTSLEVWGLAVADVDTAAAAAASPTKNDGTAETTASSSSSTSSSNNCSYAVSGCGGWTRLLSRKPHAEYMIAHHSHFVSPTAQQNINTAAATAAAAVPAWIIMSNVDACENFKVDYVLDDSTTLQRYKEQEGQLGVIDTENVKWHPLIAYDENFKLESVELLENFIIVTARVDCRVLVFFQSMAFVRNVLERYNHGQQRETSTENSFVFDGFHLERDFYNMRDILEGPMSPTTSPALPRTPLQIPTTEEPHQVSHPQPGLAALDEPNYIIQGLDHMCSYEADALENFHSNILHVTVTSFIVPSLCFEVDLTTLLPAVASSAAAAEEDYDVSLGAPASFSKSRSRDDKLVSCIVPKMLKQDPIRGRYDPTEYRVTQIWADATESVAVPPTTSAENQEVPKQTAKAAEYEPLVVMPNEDGVVKIPMTLCFRKDKLQRGSNAIMLNVYGSYGDPTDPEFLSERISLLDRGMIVAICGVRGGGELGRLWRNSGRMQYRMNSITDFIACARYVVREKWCHPEKIIARGGSAGGTVVAAAANYEPNLFACVSAMVPFVDCLSTLLDPSIPLTISEWDEFGNPRDSVQDYETIARYSPMDTIPVPSVPASSPEWAKYFTSSNRDSLLGEKFASMSSRVDWKKLPHYYIETGWGDPRVAYWEPAALAARLRDRAELVKHHLQQEGQQQDENIVDRHESFIIQKCNLDAGHGGSSGRYEALKELSIEYAFLLWAVGLHSVSPPSHSGKMAAAKNEGSSSSGSELEEGEQ